MFGFPMDDGLTEDKENMAFGAMPANTMAASTMATNTMASTMATSTMAANTMAANTMADKLCYSVVNVDMLAETSKAGGKRQAAHRFIKCRPGPSETDSVFPSSDLSLESSPSSGSSSVFESSPVRKHQVPIKRRFHPYSIVKKPRRRFVTAPPARDAGDAARATASSEPELPVVANKVRWEGDMYTPQWIRGEREAKEGRCPVCPTEHWFRIKQSAYWYHLNYHHGVSANTGLPYPAPVDFKVQKITGLSETSLRVSGLCASCREWTIIQTRYLEGADKYKTTGQGLEALIEMDQINYMAWYRHCQRCIKPVAPTGRAKQK